MTVVEAIRTIIKEQGVGIFRDPDRYNKIPSMIMDYSSRHERDVQLFCLSCQNGLLRYGGQLVYPKDSEEREAAVLSAIKMLQHDAFMDRKYALRSVKMLLDGLEIDIEINEHRVQIKNTEIEQAVGYFTEPTKERSYNIWLTDHYDIVFDPKMIQDLKQRAHKGDVNAILLLGNCYLRGIAVPMNSVEAEAWYRLALKIGDDNEKEVAREKLNEVFNRQRIWT